MPPPGCPHDPARPCVECAAARAHRDVHALAADALRERDALRAALRALVDALPKCSTFVSLYPPRNCPEPATHLGETRVLRCEAHARESLGGREPEDYGYAAQVAAARKALGDDRG